MHRIPILSQSHLSPSDSLPQISFNLMRSVLLPLFLIFPDFFMIIFILCQCKLVLAQFRLGLVIGLFQFIVNL